MKSVALATLAVGAMAMLSACGNMYDVEKVSMMPDQGSAFAKDLHKYYSERAKFEKGEEDWISVSFFNQRAEMAAMGQVPALQKPEERSLKKDVNAIKMGYVNLAAALGHGAAEAAPDACARAQTWFEHWMEQSEEGHQPKDIAWTRGEFEKALPDCQGMPMKKEPMAMMPKPLIVYFPFNSAEVSSAADSQIKAAIAEAKKAGVTRAVVIGHTDTSGSAAYNMALSKKRAEAVARDLMANGIGTKIQSSGAGETSPMEKTDDGVKNRLNPRVEVMFEK